jgi:protease-4
MAKKRDIIIGVIIAGSFVITFGFLLLVMIGLSSADGDFDLAGLGSKVGVIELFGVIDEASGRPVIKYLDRYADNDAIKAVVIHVNSPGGGAAISQEIFDAVRRVSQEKPIVAAMASVAASGGLYVAAAADRIVANPATITGSIGVIFQFHTAGELLDKIGIATETIKSGELKDVGTYSREMTRKEGLMLRSVVMDTYEQFVGAVAEGRGMEVKDIYPIADGSIFTGMQAYNLGLVDTLGGLKEAIDLAAELAEIDGKPRVVRPYRRKKVSIFDLFGSLTDGINGLFDEALVGPQLMYLYR